MTGLGQPQQPAPYQTADDVEEVSVPLSVAEVRGVDVPVGVVIGRGHVVGQGCADRDFHTFEGVEAMKPQLAIEDVQVQDVVELGTGGEGVSGSLRLEGDRVGGEPVVPEVPQVSESAVPVRNHEPPALKLLEHPLVGERGLREGLRPPCPHGPSHFTLPFRHEAAPGKEKSPKCASWRGVGDVVGSV